MKNFIKGTVFIIILFILAFSLTIFYERIDKKTSDNVSKAGLVGEKVNSIDYLVLGDSESYTGVIPLEIWGKYGYTGYVSGTPVQRLYQSLHILEDALQNQQPKLVLIETNAIFREQRKKDKIPYLLNKVFPVIKYHDNWKFAFDPSHAEKTVDRDKGYKYSTKIMAADYKNYRQYTSKKRIIPEKNIKYLQAILDLCKENNIKVIFITIPTCKNWNYKKHNAMIELSNKLNIPFYDFNLDDKVNIDWKHDTQDKGDHLNYYGATKVTNALSDHIHELNILTDHRHEDYYSSWNKAYQNFQKEINNK